jgi:hypothetical protein
MRLQICRQCVAAINSSQTYYRLGGTKSEITVHNFRFVNPNEGIQNNPELRAEAASVEEVADHVKAGRLLAVSHFETIFEAWGLPKMDSAQGKFYGASVGEVEAPVKCDRLLFSAGLDSGEMQHSFLSRIRHRRFLELQKATGAYQGKDRTTATSCSMPLQSGALSTIIAIFSSRSIRN